MSLDLSSLVTVKENFVVDRGQCMGYGQYGSVYLAKDLRNGGNVVAYKELKELPIGLTFDQQQMIVSEIQILSQTKHPATLSLLGFVLPKNEKERIGIITPFMKNGSLQQALTNDAHEHPIDGWNATKKSINLFGIAAGMLHLHSRSPPICHRDLKAANVLLNDNLEPCICDFGVSRIVADLMQTVVGTPLYMAPEILDGSDINYTTSVDVYAYALVMYSFFVGAGRWYLDNNNPVPNGRYYTIYAHITAGKRYKKLDNIPDMIWDLIQQCWAQNPDNRPSFSDIIRALMDSPEAWVFPGTDIPELQRYMLRITDSGEVLQEVATASVIGSPDLIASLRTTNKSTTKKRKFAGFK